MLYFTVIMIMSAMLFVIFQQFAFGKYNGKFLMIPLITSVVLMLAGGIGYIATVFTSDIRYFIIMAICGFTGMIVCTAMIITYKTNAKK